MASALLAAPLPPEVATRIDRVFARWDKTDSPGAIVGIAQDGETVFLRGYGMASLEHGVAMSPDTISETGSVAKQFTAAAVTLLAVRGQLSLDDPLKQHLPELPDFARAITLRMLLLHTSGLRDIHGLFDLMGHPTYAGAHENREVLELVARQRDLNFPPGTEYAYSNTGYLLLTFVVERASGRPFAQFCHEAVLAPRGLTHTAWRTNFAKIVPGRASAYAPERDGTFRVDMPYSNIHGNGGLLTTVGDLLRWNGSFENATGEWAEVVRQMQAPGTLNDGRPIENGLGLRIGKYRGLDEVSHSGATAGYSTFLARFPEPRLSIAVLGNCNGLDGGALTYRIVDTLPGLGLAPAVRPPPVTLSRAELAAHAGLYRCAGHDLVVRFAMRGDRLTINGVEMIPVGPHTFLAGSAGTRFVFDRMEGGTARRVNFTTARINRDFLAVPPAAPAAARLAEYAGDYHSPELDVTVPVSVQGGALAIRVRPQPAAPAEPTFADGFAWSRGWHLTFTRDAGGKVTGLEATSANGRCRRVKFVRRETR